MRQGAGIVGVMEQAAAVLSNPLHQRDVGLVPDGHGGNGGLELLLHHRNQVDVIAAAAAGFPVAQDDHMFLAGALSLQLTLGLEDRRVEISLPARL